MIYFIQCEKTFLVKIGYAGNDPVRRLSALQIGSPSRLHLVAVIGGSREAEGKVHRKFQKYRVRGEWFEPSPKIFAFMARRLARFGTPMIQREGCMPSTVIPQTAEERLESVLGKQIVEFLKSAGPSARMWPSEIAKAIGEERKNHVRSIVGRLSRRGIIQREGRCYFYPVNGDIQAQ